MNEYKVTILGAGLAGCEAALWLAGKGVQVELYEQKPVHFSPAHKSEGFAELICSNSLKAERLDSASGLLKEEMRRMDSRLLTAAEETRVAAGGALAVDRDAFSAAVTRMVEQCENITVHREQVETIDESAPILVATGPLTDGALADEIGRLTGDERLHFYDAVAPIVTAESLDYGKVFAASRYDRGEADYLNCPFNKAEYEAFHAALAGAERAPLHDFDTGAEQSAKPDPDAHGKKADTVTVYEGCMPIEIMAARGADTMRFGPLRPVGLVDPNTGHRPWANVQLRAENKERTLYNIVGFQTNLKWGEQKRVFSMIPGLENAEFVLPMTFRDKLWGYAGIDVIGEHRDWQNEDYQWFASLVNIINICIELQRSKREAQIERDYLQNLYRYMPLGYVRFRMIYDKTGTPVDYKVLDSNYAAEKIIGKSQADYVGRLASELEIEDMPEYLKVFAKVLQVEQHVEKEVRLLASGRYVHVVMYSTTPEEVICLLSDMTEMYETHEALDRSEKLLRNIYDNIPVGIELYDRNGLLVDLNNKDLEIFGIRDKEDVLGVDFFKNPILDEEVWRRVRNREEFSFKAYYPFDRLNGYYVTSKQGRLEIYSSVCMLYDAQGRLSNFFLINIDNTEINRAHSRIAEFESSFSLVSRFGKVGYCRFDLVSKEGYGVPQWYYNLGEKEDTPLDQILGVYKHVNSSDRAEVLESIRQVKAGEIDSFSHDLRIDADGRQKWTRINVMRNPLNNDPSKIEMVCVNYDITELKETEKNLIEAKNKAEVSDRLKSAFLANMSHEIRTPLNAIVGFSNLIAETEDPDERREYVAIVQENNELLLKLISDILDLSKIEAGTLEFNDVEFDVNQMCQEIVRSLSLKVLDKPVELRFGDHLPECRLVGDKTRITQVLINFINNALKFTREGSVTLGYRCDDGMMLTFYVEDTGTGIPEQEQESVFERFVKLNSFVQGTGLGLAISKSIVEQMGGRIGLNSEPGKGSCFWFTHPYIRTRSVSAVASDAEMRQPGVSEGKMPVVLVAEDTDSNFLLVSLILKKGYEVLRAHNGAEAVRMCREFAPDVVLMDMKMPVMDGLEATRQIREAGSSVPIIAVTAYAYDSDRCRVR